MMALPASEVQTLEFLAKCSTQQGLSQQNPNHYRTETYRTHEYLLGLGIVILGTL